MALIFLQVGPGDGYVLSPIPDICHRHHRHVCVKKKLPGVREAFIYVLAEFVR